MTLVRRLARPALSAVFVTGGIDTLKNPVAKVPSAQDIAPKIAAKLPWLPQDTKSLVTINAVVQVGAGLMLAKVAGRKTMIPFGPYMIVGTFLAVFWGQRISDWYRGILGH